MRTTNISIKLVHKLFYLIYFYAFVNVLNIFLKKRGTGNLKNFKMNYSENVKSKINFKSKEHYINAIFKEFIFDNEYI